MRILIDTNIFIPLEDSLIGLNPKTAELCRIVSAKHELLLHPATIDDIKRDADVARRNRTLARITRYPLLEAPPTFSDGEEAKLLGEPRKENDKVDNLILLALHRNCVNWLISEDEGLHKKAKSIGQAERVLTVDRAVVALNQMYSRELQLYPTIEDVPCHSLSISDSIFDSLRDGYGDFDRWLESCQRSGRRAWTSKGVTGIDAICIYKQEENEIVTHDKKILAGKALKLCTFKVIKLGYKIGELLLKQAFTYAFDNNISHVYVTVEPDQHKFLEELLLDFGFYYFGIDTKGRDNVYVKDVFPVYRQEELSCLDFAIKYYPHAKLSCCSAYLVPITPIYHEILFPELKKQPDFFDGPRISAGNSIRQAYLCSARTKSIKKGDLLFFYRTSDEKAITTYGVVDQFHIESDPEKITQWVSKRTVFNQEEINEMALHATDGIRVILFRFMGHFSQSVNYSFLKSAKIVSGPIQSITKISFDKATIITGEAGINDRILSN
ncbi:MAG TPA: hypothetical protein PLF22_05685 [Pseudomonadales bacterium]|nr:hypothetical protein [Pseudomonadales bacterium]